MIKNYSLLIMAYFKQIPLYLIILYITVFVFSVGFGIYGLSKHLVFGFDQARDAYETYAIWHNHDFKILGPSSDLQGVHHGVLWYYLLVLPYAAAFGNPIIVAVIFFIFSFLTIPLCGFVTYKLFRNFHIALLASVLYVSSPLFQVFTRWLANPLIALYTVPFLLFFLWRYISKQKKTDLLFVGLFFGLLIQADFAFGLFLITLPIYWLSYKIKFRLQDLAFFGIGFLLAISTYILAEIRFNGKAVLAIINFLNSSLNSPRSLMETISLIIERVNELLSVTIIPFPYAMLIFVLLIGVFILRGSKIKSDRSAVAFLSIWLSTFVIFYLFKSGFLHNGFMFGPFIVPLIILGSYLLIRTVTNFKLLFILLIVVFLGQFYTLYFWFKTEYSPLSVQYGISLSLEREIIDYTYEQSEGERFTIITITNPLHINTLWAYLYQIYGEKKYGYLPYHGGKDQKGYLGNLLDKPFGTKYRYIIIEPTTGIPDYFIEQIIAEENKTSDIMEEKKFGQFLVQKRMFRENKHSME